MPPPRVSRGHRLVLVFCLLPKTHQRLLKRDCGPKLRPGAALADNALPYDSASMAWAATALAGPARGKGDGVGRKHL
jgi:hypothetical protein